MPRQEEIVPVIHSLLGICPNAARSEPQIKIVKICLGYGSSRLMNVGCPFEVDAKCSLATVPQTVAVSPTCCPACVGGIFLFSWPTARNVKKHPQTTNTKLSLALICYSQTVNHLNSDKCCAQVELSMAT